MTTCRKVLILALTVLLLGLFAPTAEAATTAGSLRAQRTTVLPGQWAKFTGRIPPQRRHKVVVQYSIYRSAYNNLKTITTDSRGRFSFSARIGFGYGFYRYRVKSPGTHVYVTPTVRINVADRPIDGATRVIYQGVRSRSVRPGGFQGDGQLALVNDLPEGKNTGSHCLVTASSTRTCGITGESMSDNGRFLAASAADTISVYDKTTGTTVSVAVPDEVTLVHSRPRTLDTGGVVFTGDNINNPQGEGDVYLWQPGAPARRLTNGQASGVRSELSDATPTGSVVLIQTDPTPADPSYQLRRIDTSTGATTVVVRQKQDLNDNSARLSDNGGRVVFTSDSSGLTKQHGCPGVHVLFTWTPDGGIRRPAGCYNVGGVDVSGNGSRIAFTTTDAKVAGGDNDFASDLFLLDVPTGRILRLSKRSRANESDGWLSYPILDASGHSVVFAAGQYDASYAETSAVYRWNSN